MRSWPAFVAGALAGVLAGVVAVQWLVPARPAAVEAAAERAHPAPRLPRSEPVSTLESAREPVRELAAAAPPAPEEPPLAQATAPIGAGAEEPTHVLPTLRRCLLDPELNPEGRDCTDENVRKGLQRFIDEQNTRLGHIEEQHEALVESLLAAKLEAHVDPPETWASYPREDILLRRYHASVGTSGPGKTTATILRRGESPEIEALERELDGTLVAAREELRRRISSDCPR